MKDRRLKSGIGNWGIGDCWNVVGRDIGFISVRGETSSVYTEFAERGRRGTEKEGREASE